MFDLPLLAAFAEAFGARLPEIRRVLDYLIAFGYLNPILIDRSASIVDRIAAFKQALSEFQRISGAGKSGEVDAQTLAKMTEPRCGCRDALRAVEFARWRKNRLT